MRKLFECLVVQSRAPTDFVLDIVRGQMPHHSILVFNLCVFYVFIPEFPQSAAFSAQVWAEVNKLAYAR